MLRPPNQPILGPRFGLSVDFPGQAAMASGGHGPILRYTTRCFAGRSAPEGYIWLIMRHIYLFSSYPEYIQIVNPIAYLFWGVIVPVHNELDSANKSFLSNNIVYYQWLRHHLLMPAHNLLRCSWTASTYERRRHKAFGSSASQRQGVKRKEALTYTSRIVSRSVRHVRGQGASLRTQLPASCLAQQERTEATVHSPST